MAEMATIFYLFFMPEVFFSLKIKHNTGMKIQGTTFQINVCKYPELRIYT
jgi:hypothetical protein